MIIVSFFWKNGCCKDRRVRSSNLSISIGRKPLNEDEPKGGRGIKCEAVRET